jgi:hypothetical protein
MEKIKRNRVQKRAGLSELRRREVNETAELIGGSVCLVIILIIACML